MVWTVWVFVVGLCFGSFANVLIYRLPRKMSVITPASACVACGKFILPYNLLPLVSWVMLRGRCKHCHTKISKRYPIVELTCGLLFAGMVLLTPTLSAIFLSIFAFLLLTVSFIDSDTQQIPDCLLVIATIVGVIWVVLGHYFLIFPLTPGFIDAGLGILLGGMTLLILDRLTMMLYKKDGFGYGDVKLMAVAGLFLGWQLVCIAFFFAFITGGIYATALLATGHAKRNEYIAFGPFLCTGIIFALWFGRALLEIII